MLATKSCDRLARKAFIRRCGVLLPGLAGVVAGAFASGKVTAVEPQAVRQFVKPSAGTMLPVLKHDPRSVARKG